MANEPDSTLRTCKHCQIEKRLADFPKLGRWHNRTCKGCRAGHRRAAYAKREGEYANRDTQTEKTKRLENSRRQRGRYVWQESWLNERPSIVCSRCRIELPANPAWFALNSGVRSGLSSWCRSCTMQCYFENRQSRLEANNRCRQQRLLERPDKVRDVRLKWQRENREKKRALEQRWKEQNPERYRQHKVAASSRRRAIVKAATGSFSADDIGAMHKAQKGRCWYCSKKLNHYHVEHRIPLSRGGSNDPSNLVLACPPCNWSKGAKMPWEMEAPSLL